MKEPTTATNATTTRETALPVLPPVSALVEIAVLFGALWLVDWLHPALELMDVRPHPFWIPVLLLSLQYGTVSGLFAAAVAIGLTATAGFPEQGTSETYFSYLIKIWIEPMLWISAAVLIGQFRMRQIAHKQELLAQVNELSSQRAALADYARNLRNHCSALERQIAGREQGDIGELLAAVHRANAAAGTGQPAGMLRDILARALPGAGATLYALDATGLRPLASTAAGGERPSRPSIPSTDPLYATIVGLAAPVSVLDREGEACLAGQGLVAVPVLAPLVPADAGRRRVLGMLLVDAMPASTLNEASIPALAGLTVALLPLFATASGAAVVPLPVAIPLPVSPTQKLWRHLRWFRKPEHPPAAAAIQRSAKTIPSVTR